MKHFNKCTTLEELKKAYKTLAKKLHPDLNPNQDTTKQFQDMLNEFEFCFEKLKNTHKNVDGEYYTKETTEKSEEFIKVINDLIGFEDITIEIIGCFIWVYGNTYTCKDVLKQHKLKWSKSRKAWYLSPKGFIKKSSKHFSFNEMRDMFGSEVVNKQLHLV